MRTRVVLLVILALGTYWNGLSTPFLLDDRSSILTNTSIETLALPGAFATPSDTPVARRPLVNWSFALNYAFDERNPYWYHAANLLIHLLAALTLFGIVRRTLLLPPFDRAFGAAATSIAWVSALIWVLHPLNTEIVEYVTQRSEGLLGLFYLLTLYCAIRAGTSRRNGRWVAGAIASCAAGMLCKESMLTAPLMVVLYDRVYLFDSWREVVARRSRLYAGLAACFAVLAVAVASSTRTSAGFGSVAAGLGGVSWWEYLLNQTQMIPRYLYLTIWPRPLVVDYGLPQAVPLATAMVPGLLLSIAVVLVIVGLVRWPRVAFPGAWFFITLAPTSSFVPIATEVAAERRMYLPLAALIVLVVATAYSMARRRGIGPMPLQVAAAVVVGLLATGTLLRNREYQDPVRLAQATVDRWPSGRAYVHLGTLYSEGGRQDDAIREFRRAAEIFPPGHYALGVALVERGEVDAGLAHLRTFIDQAPDHAAVAGARDLIGRVLTDRGELDAASREFERLIAHNAFNTRAIALLAEVRLRQNRIPEAIVLFERAYRLDPAVGRDPNVMKRYGTALATVNRLNDAQRVFAEAAAANPLDASLQKLWGRSLAADGRFAAAAERFRRARELAPDDPEALQLVAAIEQTLRTAGSQAGRP